MDIKDQVTHILKRIYTQGYSDCAANLPIKFEELINKECETFTKILEQRCENCGLVSLVSEIGETIARKEALNESENEGEKIYE